MLAKKKGNRAPRTQKPLIEDQSEIKMIEDGQVAQVREWEKIAAAGERIDNFFRGGAYALLNDEILVPFEQEIVNSIKNPAFSIENREQLYQFQSSLRGIHQIRERIEKKIRAGMEARAELTQILHDARVAPEDE